MKLTPRWIALVVITALTVYLAWLVISPFVNVLLWAIVITVVASPLNHALRSRWKSPNLCAALTLVAVVIVLVIPISIIVTTLVGRIDETAESLQVAVSKVSDPSSGAGRFLTKYGIDLKTITGGLWHDGTTQPTTLPAEGLSSFAMTLKSYSGAIAAQTAAIVSRGILALVQFLLVLFTSYYLLRDGGRLLLTGARNAPF